MKINACFAVKTWRNNDGFLGDGSFQAGIRATELRQGRDVGTSVVTGATVERFEIVKWYFLEVDDDTGYDAATDLITRAMTALGPEVRANGAEEPDGPSEPEARDLLRDLDEVLGTDPVPSADVPALLRDLAPDWEPYRRLSGVELRAWLADEFGIKVPTTGRRFPLDPATVRDRLRSRRTGDDNAAGDVPNGGE